MKFAGNIEFLSGDGEMAELTRTKDWSQTSVGIPENWPQSLRTTLSILLHSKFPMFLFWGTDLICFYNDAYRPSLGQNGKHPSILGMKAKDAWPEIWAVIKPLIDQVISNKEATWSEDQLIPIYRNGKIEDVYWTFSYSPVSDESGKPAGVFVTCVETTEKIMNLKKLEESKDQLKFAIEATELATWDLNPVTNKFIGDARYTEWFGLPAQNETDNDLALKVIADEDRERVIKEYTTALDYSSGSKYDIEYRIRPVNKAERILRAKGKAWFADDKTCYRFNGTLQDITKQSLDRKKIEESEKELRDLADSLPALVWTTDKSGKQTFSSRRWNEFTGIDPKETGSFEKMVHPDDFKNIMDAWTRSLSSGTTYRAEVRIKSKEGDYNWFYVNGEPIKNEKGDIEKWVGAFTNINDLKKAEEKIRLTSERFSVLADSMPQFVWTGDAEGNLNYYNKAVYDYSGLSIQQIQNDGWLQIVHPDEREENVRQWLHSISTGNDFVFEHRFRRHDGEYRWQLSRATAQRDANGNIQMWVGTSTDINEIKELDQQKDSFISMASHELKTPVTTIKAYGQIAETMLEKSGDTATLGMIKKMGTQVNRLTTLIEDLLNITRIQKGKLFYDEDVFDFNELVKDAIDDMQKISGTHQIKNGAGENVKVFGDKDKLSQVLNNLISNAIKYSPGANKISITSEPIKDGVQLSVQDFGIGISPEEQKHVFEQFYRVSGANQTTFPGMGIGLYICLEIIKRHSGKIWVESFVGKGSIFYIWLPADHRSVIN